MAQIFPLQGSLPGLTPPVVKWQSNVVCDHRFKVAPAAHNLRTTVPYDLDWGRSSWAVPAVQQYDPYDIVDGKADVKTPFAAQQQEDYVRVFYDPAFIAPFVGESAFSRTLPRSFVPSVQVPGCVPPSPMHK